MMKVYAAVGTYSAYDGKGSRYNEKKNFDSREVAHCLAAIVQRNQIFLYSGRDPLEVIRFWITLIDRSRVLALGKDLTWFCEYQDEA